MKCFKNIAIMLCLIILMGAVTVNLVKAADKCTASATITASDDCGSNPLAQKIYDPCDASSYSIYYHIEFDRTLRQQPSYSSTIRIRIVDTGAATDVFFRDIHSWNYSAGSTDNVVDGLVPVWGTSNSHTFKIERVLGDTQMFENIQADVDYRIGTPD